MLKILLLTFLLIGCEDINTDKFIPGVTDNISIDEAIVHDSTPTPTPKPTEEPHTLSTVPGTDYYNEPVVIPTLPMINPTPVPEIPFCQPVPCKEDECPNIYLPNPYKEPCDTDIKGYLVGPYNIDRDNIIYSHTVNGIEVDNKIYIDINDTNHSQDMIWVDINLTTPYNHSGEKSHIIYIEFIQKL